jgi:hypothetical protein
LESELPGYRALKIVPGKMIIENAFFYFSSPVQRYLLAMESLRFEPYVILLCHWFFYSCNLFVPVDVCW